MSDKAKRVHIYLGSNNPEKRLEEMGQQLARILKALAREPESKEDKDPLMTSLKKKKTDLEKLKEDAEHYEEKHVNEEFKRIYITAQKLELELDRMDLQGREEAKALKRNCIILVHRICDSILIGKLHVEDCSQCSKCLRLV